MGFRASALSGHPIGKLDATKAAAELLEKRGVIQIWPETGLYRLKPTDAKKR